jgi:hypothetical protein
MKELAIRCHESIGPIRLGDSKTRVRSALETFGFALELSRRELDFFCHSSIQVEYVDGTASFIGVSFSSEYVCTYEGLNVFDTPAEELFSFMNARETSGTASCDEDGVVFPIQILSLWEADSQYDRFQNESRPIYAQVGIGDARYLDAIAKTKS